MLTCKEVTWLMVSGEIERKNIFTRLAVRFHYALCRCCPKYLVVLKNTTTLFREKFGAPSDPTTLHPLEESILTKLRSLPSPVPRA
jgi:hypothetical protein